MSTNNGWIGVNERLPSEYEHVVVHAGGLVFAAYLEYRGKSVEWYTLRTQDLDYASSITRIYHVTHWQPLPAPPAKGT